jgi:glycosyltransferase involved in cell wall biosynthesis
MKDHPLVTILINNYNYERFLKTAIDSALKQTYDNIEVIVVDDGSTDNSRDIINSYGNNIIPLLKDNGGQASAFNLGFAKSQGEIICFLDSDDFFLPEKVATVVNLFKTHNEIDWLFHPLQLTGKKVSSLEIHDYSSNLSGIYDIRKNIAQGKLGRNLPIGIVTSGMCLKRNLLKQILPMPDIINITSDDYIKYSALGLSQGFVLLEELATQRIHENNAYTFRKDKQSLEAKILILTAYYLKKDFPFLSKFANSIFALGLGIHQDLKTKPTDYSHFLETYLASLTLWEKWEVNIRAIYHRLKS